MSYLEQRRKFIEDGRPLPDKKKYIIPKKSAKRIQKEKEQGIEIVKPNKAGWFNVELTETEDKVVAEISNEPKKGNGELWRWFQSQRSKMKGVCSHCGSKTQKNDDKTFHYSICHILPKNLFKSVATNDDNWIELCYYNNSCHSNFDNNMIDIIDLNCFDEVVEKVTRMYPHIAPEERRRIPAILREYIKAEI